MAVCFFSPLVVGVCDITPHANLQIIERQGNNSGRLFCPLTTRVTAADAVILLKSTLAETQMRTRQKHPTFWKEHATAQVWFLSPKYSHTLLCVKADL